VTELCRHLDRITDVSPGLEVCETCIEVGGVWKTLRQCLVCGRTTCCNSSPGRHATRHFRETGHELIRTLEEGQDWSWCYACEQVLGRDPNGDWAIVDPFFEAGLFHARRLAADRGIFAAEPDESTPEGFPLGVWLTTYRERRRDGALEPEQAAELEALPGWEW
jgi:hypothetical protein